MEITLAQKAAPSPIVDELVSAYSAKRAILDRAKERGITTLRGLPIQDEEDALQEAFMASFRQQQKNPLFTNDNVAGYLGKACEHKRIDRIRKALKEESLDKVIETDNQNESTIIQEASLRAPQHSPETQALTHMELEEFYRALDTLKPEQKTAILLRALGYKKEETAQLMSSNANTIGTLVLRGMKKIEKCLGLPSPEAA